MSQEHKWFYSDQKEKVWTLILKLDGKWLYETNSIKCFGIRIDYKLYWKACIYDVALKLMRANAMQSWDFVNAWILKANFMPHLSHILCMYYVGTECMQDWFVLNKVMSALLLSFSNQKWWNFLIKLKLKAVFSSANMSTRNYLPSLIVGLYFPLLQ